MLDTLGPPGNNRFTATENKELIIRNIIAGLVRPVIRQRLLENGKLLQRNVKPSLQSGVDTQTYPSVHFHQWNEYNTQDDSYEARGDAEFGHDSK